MDGEPCRCGYAGEGPHPCHGMLYTCRRPARRRMYLVNGLRFALAGQQLKFSMDETWACDECWKPFAALTRSENEES